MTSDTGKGDQEVQSTAATERRSGKDRRRPGNPARVMHEQRSGLPRREDDKYWKTAVSFTEDMDP